MKNHIMIIGGMGPQASVELHRLINKKASNNASDPADFPEVLHTSITIRDFISDQSAIPAAIERIREACIATAIERASAVGLACNTAHLLVDRIPELQSGNFVSMIQAVCETVSRAGHQKVGLLASPSTIRTKLYESPLRGRGIEVVIPPEHEILEIADIIRGLITGEDQKLLRIRLTSIASTLKQAGADSIVLGCTELPLIGIDTSLAVISSLEVLAGSLLRKHSREAML